MENHNIEQLAKEITAQYVAQAQTADLQNEESKRLEASRRLLRNKAILWVLTGLVMTASLTYLGVAWYTRIATTHAVTFEVVDYDLAVNDNTENEFLVNVYNYSNVTKKHAAPGTDGYIPLKLSARHSEIDVDFSIAMESMMLPALEDHFKFFVMAKPTGRSDSAGNPIYEPLVLDLMDKTEGGITASVVIPAHEQYFLKNFDEGEGTQMAELLAAGYEKVYLAPNASEAGKAVLEGTVNMDSEKMVYIYWEWYLDAEDAAQTEGSGIDSSKYSEEEWKTYVEKWDELDTDVGKYPEKYKDAMMLHLTCVGVQSTPMLEQESKESVETPVTP